VVYPRHGREARGGLWARTMPASQKRALLTGDEGEERVGQLQP
jgi:hypothetical protein